MWRSWCFLIIFRFIILPGATLIDIATNLFSWRELLGQSCINEPTSEEVFEVQP